MAQVSFRGVWGRFGIKGQAAEVLEYRLRPVKDIALEHFRPLAHQVHRPEISFEEIQQVERIELAMVGQNGFGVHDPSRRYRVKGLEGEFSGLAMVSYLYVAMQRMAPGTDIGFDLAAEYAEAQSLFDASN
jgi:hypothetical protein